MEDHMPLKGIKVGDIGLKMGYNGIDNGWLSFDQVRTKRTNLMSRFSFVHKDGKFERRGDPRILYSAMVQTRMAIIEDSYIDLWKGLLIATRYAAVRR